MKAIMQIEMLTVLDGDEVSVARSEEAGAITFVGFATMVSLPMFSYLKSSSIPPLISLVPVSMLWIWETRNE
jgi:hypothetical protein